MECVSCHASVEADELKCRSCGADLSSVLTTLALDPAPSPSAPLIEFTPRRAFAGRYTIIERIGRGGMGVVYKAIDTTLDGEVALKLMRPELAARPSFIEGFKREVRLTRQITHANVCRVHDIGESQGILYISMEW